MAIAEVLWSTGQGQFQRSVGAENSKIDSSGSGKKTGGYALVTDRQIPNF